MEEDLGGVCYFERVEQPFTLKGLVQFLPQLVRGQQGVFARSRRHDYVGDMETRMVRLYSS